MISIPLRNIVISLIDLLVPPRESERIVRALTADELHSIRREEGLPYTDPRVRALMWELKYHANPRALTLCSEILADELLAAAAEELGTPLLIPVPMHTHRRAQRGHNQTELLCESGLTLLDTEAKRQAAPQRGADQDGNSEKERGRFAGVPIEYAPHALSRTVDTPTQQGLERSKRLKNVKNSMLADEQVVRGRACIVVDDITTTGATFAEAARALKAAGARSVHTIALAHS